MAAYEIPLTPAAQQFFIPLAGTTYSLSVKWCRFSACWVLDIATADGIPLRTGLPLVTGGDLLSQHKHLGIGGTLEVQTDTDLYRVPAYNELGVAGHLYFVTP